MSLQCINGVHVYFKLFFLQTIALSYLTGVISSYHEAWAVLIAMSICAMVCLGVTLFAAFAPIDFTKCTAFLWFFGLAFFLFGLACMITWAIAGPNKVSNNHENHFICFNYITVCAIDENLYDICYRKIETKFSINIYIF